MVEHSEVSGQTTQHWELLGGVAGHDLGVLVVGGLTTDLTGEGADVVGDEPVHGGRRTAGGAFQGSVAPSPILNRLWSSRVLKSWVLVCEVLLARVGVGRVHIRGDRVGNHLALGPVLCPLWYGIRELFADHTLEGLAVVGSIEMAQHVVQGPVLEKDNDDVVHGVAAIRHG